MARQTAYKKNRNFWWPVGGSLLGLLVVPIAIEEYPELFKDNEWILPATIFVMIACWIIPLFSHSLFQRILSWLKAVPRAGSVLVVLVPALVTVLILIASHKAFEFHKHHLQARLQRFSIKAKCVPKDGSPCAVDCSVSNNGSETERNVALGFQGIYPHLTRLVSLPETHMSLKKENDIPERLKEIDYRITAFTVDIPYVPPRVTLDFSLSTEDVANFQACQFVVNEVQGKQKKIINDVVSVWPKADASKLDVNDLFSQSKKSSSLYRPGNLMSESTHFPVEFITEKEQQATQLYEATRKRYPNPSLKGDNCGLLVLASEGNTGKPHYMWTTVSFVKSYMDIPLGPNAKCVGCDRVAFVNIIDAKGNITGTQAMPRVPFKYACEASN